MQCGLPTTQFKLLVFLYMAHKGFNYFPFLYCCQIAEERNADKDIHFFFSLFEKKRVNVRIANILIGDATQKKRESDMR